MIKKEVAIAIDSLENDEIKLVETCKGSFFTGICIKDSSTRPMDNDELAEGYETQLIVIGSCDPSQYVATILGLQELTAQLIKDAGPYAAFLLEHKDAYCIKSPK